MNWLMDLIFGRLFKALDGHKTTIGAVCGVLTGIVGLVGHYWPDTGLPAMPVDSAMLTISAAFTALGIGGKLEKVVKK